MNDHQRKEWYPKIFVKQHGEFCNGCGVQPLEWVMEPPYFINLLCRTVFITKKLFVEHKDNESSNNTIDNFQFLCRACNRIKNPVVLKTKSTREKTPEMERRDEREDKFRNYWIQRILADRLTEFDDLVASACEYSDLALRTGQDIAKKLVSTEGFYKRFEYNGDSWVCPKDEFETIWEEIKDKEKMQFNAKYKGRP